MQPLPLLKKLQYLSVITLQISLFQGAAVTDFGLCSFVLSQSLQLLDISDCWLVSSGSLLRFHKLYLRLLLRHESLLAVTNDHAHHEYVAKNTSEYEQASTCRKGKKLESAYTRKSHSNRIKKKVLDERIKYSISELLKLRDAAHSLNRLTVVDPSLSAILINIAGKNAI